MSTVSREDWTESEMIRKLNISLIGILILKVPEAEVIYYKLNLII